MGQQQGQHGGRHLRVTGCQVVEPWPLKSFQFRQTLQTRHLDVGHEGSRHEHLLGRLQFGDGAGQNPQDAKPFPRR